jgi:hypothetical protein
VVTISRITRLHLNSDPVHAAAHRTLKGPARIVLGRGAVQERSLQPLGQLEEPRQLLGLRRGRLRPRHLLADPELPVLNRDGLARRLPVVRDTDLTRPRHTLKRLVVPLSAHVDVAEAVSTTSLNDDGSTHVGVVVPARVGAIRSVEHVDAPSARPHQRLRVLAEARGFLEARLGLPRERLNDHTAEPVDNLHEELIGSFRRLVCHTNRYTHAWRAVQRAHVPYVRA